MAAGPYRRTNGWQVKWREDGLWQSETLADKVSTKEIVGADEFKMMVEKAGNRWPVDSHGATWISGYGFPDPEPEESGTPFLEYAQRRIRMRVEMGRLSGYMAERYGRYAQEIAGSLLVAPVLVEQIEADPDAAMEAALDPANARPILRQLVGQLSDEEISQHAQGVCVEDIDINAIRAFFRWKRVRPAHGDDGAGTKWATVKKYHGFLHGVLEQAYYEDLIPKNPCKLTAKEIGSDEAFDPIILSPEEFWLLHSGMDARWHDFLEVSVGCGCRFGEITASRKRDWHPDERRLRIDEAWKKGRAGTGYYRGKPKTAAGIRDVYVSVRVAELLNKAAEGKGPDDLLFTAAQGGYLRQNSFCEERWLPAVRKAHKLGLVRDGEPVWPRFHDLRHTHISWLRKGGLANEMIRGMVGHTDEAMTEKYGEIPVEIKQQAITAIDGALGRRLRAVGA